MDSNNFINDSIDNLNIKNNSLLKQLDEINQWSISIGNILNINFRTLDYSDISEEQLRELRKLILLKICQITGKNEIFQNLNGVGTQ